jgi:hypothetical protein
MIYQSLCTNAQLVEVLCLTDEQPLLDDIDEEGAGIFAVRRADFDDTPETEKKREDMLFVPSVFSGRYIVTWVTTAIHACQYILLYEKISKF